MLAHSLLVQAIVLVLSGFSLAQNLSVDPNWREPSTARTKSERISIAQNAINTMLPQLNSSIGGLNCIGYWQSANGLSAQAIQDQITGDYKQGCCRRGLELVLHLRKNYDQIG